MIKQKGYFHECRLNSIQDYKPLLIHIDGQGLGQNSLSSHPCPICGDNRILWELLFPYSDNFELECKLCHTVWLIPMDDNDILLYTNIELDRIILRRTRKRHSIENTIDQKQAMEAKERRMQREKEKN